MEFPDGQTVLLNFLHEGQQAIVLQLPVTHEGVKVQKLKGRRLADRGCLERTSKKKVPIIPK